MFASILSILLLSSTSNAAALPKRDEIWKNPKDGNLHIDLNDAKVNIGACRAKNIIETLREHCKDESGICEPEPWQIECPSDGVPYTIEVKPDSQYNSKLKNKLIDALKAAIETEKVEESREVTGAKGGGCTGCPFFPTKSTFYSMPGFISVSHSNENAPPDVIAVTITNPGDDGGKGFCETATGIAEKVAGSVSGVAGGIFGLGSMACDLL